MSESISARPEPVPGGSDTAEVRQGDHEHDRNRSSGTGLFSTDGERLAGVGALYLLYLAMFVIMGPAATVWPAVLAAAGSCVATGWAARGAPARDQPFFVLLAVSLLLQAIVEWLYEPTSLVVSSWMVVELIALFAWMCAWALLAYRLFRQQPSAPFVSALSFVPLAALIGLYLTFYLDHSADITSEVVRFDIALAGFELVGLLLCLMCVLFGAGLPLVLMVSGFALFASSDFVFLNPELSGPGTNTGDLSPVWMLGRAMILGGAVTLPQLRAGGGDHLEDAAHTRSGVTGVLVFFAVTLVLAVGLIAEAPVHPNWEALIFVLACVLLVIVVAQTARRFDQAISALAGWVECLMDRHLKHRTWPEASLSGSHTMRITRLDTVVSRISASAARLRHNVIFLGPERLFPSDVPGVDANHPSCFVVMPFNQPWSGHVHSSIRHACHAQGVRSVRGDDIFTPTDILSDIWLGINQANFVIADITGRNPNVLYELGIAHTLAKPVLILTQSAEDVPIDLATRRMIIYGDASNDALTETIATGVREVVEEHGWLGRHT